MKLPIWWLWLLPAFGEPPEDTVAGSPAPTQSQAAPDADPAAPGAGVTALTEVPEDIPRSEPAPAAVPPVVPAPALSGDETLTLAIRALATGEYEKALDISIRGASQFPELAPSFSAITAVASDQLARNREDSASPPVLTDGRLPQNRPGRSRYAESAYAVPKARRAPPNVQFGFDAGFPTGFRGEVDFNAKIVDSWGLRAGGNALIFNKFWLGTDVTTYLDVRVTDRWQVEPSIGVFVYYGWTYAQGGLAVQYDSKGPFQAQIGARIGPEASVVPDVGVAFIW